jgi:L-rhamnose mutarotase
MRMFAQALDLADDPALIAEYEAYHRAVWPEVKAALRAIGIAEMKIFRTGTRLFMIYEAPDDFDPARDFQSYTAVPEARRWDELMRRFQRPVPGAPEGAWWTAMEKVFDLEA